MKLLHHFPRGPHAGLPVTGAHDRPQLPPPRPRRGPAPLPSRTDGHGHTGAAEPAGGGCGCARAGGPRAARGAGERPPGEEAGRGKGWGTAHAGTLRPAAEDGVGQPAGPGLLAPHQVDKLLARLGHDGAAAALGPGGRGVSRRRRRPRQPLPLRRGGAGRRRAGGAGRGLAGRPAELRMRGGLLSACPAAPAASAGPGSEGWGGGLAGGPRAGRYCLRRPSGEGG